MISGLYCYLLVRVSESDADPRSRRRHLGNCVLPGPLARATHDDEVAGAEGQRELCRAASWAHEETARVPERDRGDHGIEDRLRDAVTVPRDRVAAVAVEIGTDGIEGSAISE